MSRTLALLLLLHANGTRSWQPAGAPARRLLASRASSAATEPHSGVDHYGVLGVRSSAKPTEIRRAYKALAAKYHPDLRQTTDPEADASPSSVKCV